MKVEYAAAYRELEPTDTGEVSPERLFNGAQLWRTMVVDYTALRVTKLEDRLHWRALCEDSHDTLKPRPHPRTAPTWSRASVDTPTHYIGLIYCSLSIDKDDESVEEEESFEENHTTIYNN